MVSHLWDSVCRLEFRAPANDKLTLAPTVLEFKLPGWLSSRVLSLPSPFLRGLSGVLLELGTGFSFLRSLCVGCVVIEELGLGSLDFNTLSDRDFKSSEVREYGDIRLG